MSTRWTRRALAAALVVGCTALPALAQAPPRPGVGIGTPPAGARPAVSPYLNLLRGGDPGLNYLTLVRPQIDAMEGLEALEGQLPLLAGRSGTLGRGTGYGATYQNHYRYFLNHYRGAGLGGGFAGTGAGLAPSSVAYGSPTDAGLGGTTIPGTGTAGSFGTFGGGFGAGVGGFAQPGIGTGLGTGIGTGLGGGLGQPGFGGGRTGPAGPRAPGFRR